MTANVNVTKVLFKRGNTAQNAAYTGINGEITVDTQAKTLRIHDGVTAGGNVITAGGVVGAYSNTNAAAYIPTDPTITSIQANVAAANAAISAITGIDTSLIANAATQQTQINLINANVAAANALIPNLLAVSGNILPSANVTYSLGSEQFQWRDLWVSNNTIYIGGTPIRVDGGTLLVNNAPVSGGAYGNTQVADYLLGNISTGNITAAANVMIIGTGDAKLTLDSFNQAALLQAKKTFNRSFGAGEGASFVYSNVAGTGSITATITNDLYLKTLLERLSSQFSTPTPEFTYSYSNVRVQVYDVTNANVIANVTGVDNYGNPDEYTLLIDQPPSPDPFSVLALDISYDYLNTVGVDVDKDLFGITTDNDDIDIKSGRDIDLQARDDFFVTAGSQFTMTLNANDGQNPTDGIILETQANGTTRSWKYRFDGATEFASGLTAEPLSNYVPVTGTIIQQTAGELLQVLSSGEGAGMTVGWTDIPTSPSDLAVVSFNNVYGQVQVTTGNYAATTHTWSFTDSGNITIPGNINYANGTSILSGLGSIGNLQINNNTNQLSFGPGESNSFLYMKNDGSETRLANDNGNVQISTIKQGPGGGTYFWTFDDTGNILLPNNSSSINYANGVSILSGIGGGGTYGDANVQALLASNVSLIGSSGNIVLATLGAGSTTTVSQEGGNPGVSGQGTITGASSNSPGFALVQPGWTVTGNNLVGTTTVTGVVEAPPGFYTITTDTAEVDPFWYQDVYTFTSNTPSYSNLTVSSGNIINAGTYGQINFVANSSGDGYGLSTIQLVPYTSGYDSAYVIIDPTYPNHIHIRAGGEQDNSPAQLFLGGENSYVSVDSGLDPNVYIRSNNNDWIFGTDGTLTLPGEGVLQSLDDSVTLASLNTTTGNINSVYLGSGGGVGFFDQAIGGNWLEIFRSGAEPEIRVPVGRGNLHIQTAEGVNSYIWKFDNTGSLTFPTGGNLTFDSSATSTIDGVTNISATGTIGANVIQVLSDLTSFGASPAPVIYGFSSIATTGSAANEGNISASGNLVASQNAYVTANVFAAQYYYANGVSISQSIQNGTSNVRILSSGGLVSINVGSVSNIALFTTTGASIGGTLSTSGFTATGAVTLATASSNINIGSSQTTGHVIVGGTAQTGTILIGQSTYPQTINIGHGITGSGNTKTIQIGENGAAGSATLIDIGPATASATGTVTFNTGTVVTIANTGSNALSVAGNITGGNIVTTNGVFWANGVAFSTGGSTYGNTEVAAYLLTYPNANFATLNTTSANITTVRAANFNTANAVITGGYATGLANISVTGNATVGNLIGTSSNTTIVAGNYSSTFDTVGNVVLPSAFVSGNATVMGIAPGYAPNRPAFRIYGSSSNNWTTSNINFKGSDIVVDYNQGNYFNSTTGVFTAPVAGLYSITLNARIGNNNGQNQIMVLKNGLTSAGNVAVMWECDTNTGTAVHYGVSSVMKLAVGDILTANITVGNVQFDANDSWTVTYLG